MLRRFALLRHEDPSGVSGTGVVAYGVQFVDGPVVLRWHSDHPATSTWDSLSDLLSVHGHDGATTLHWIDPEMNRNPTPDSGQFEDGVRQVSQGRHRSLSTPAVG